VVAPSYRPLMVFVATRNGSTSDRSVAHRSTARTILLTSTSSRSPLRLRTCICTRRPACTSVVGGGVLGLLASVSGRQVNDRHGSLLASPVRKVEETREDAEG